MTRNNSKNNFNIAKIYGAKVFDDTVHYQKKYNFNIGTGNHATWNNEADAFKHTYMQAQLALWLGQALAKTAGDYHEVQGNLWMGQSRGENNMDLWNNQQGREIAREIVQQYGPVATIPFQQKINNIIAEKVINRMKKGQLITTPTDTRIYKPKGFKGSITVPAAQLYTKEDIKNMTNKEFEEKGKEIMEQIKTIGLPSKKELYNNTSTFQKSEKQTGKWVTINGNHVLIKD